MVAQPELSLALIGCGKMGSALLRGWLSSGKIKHAYVLDPTGLPDEFEDFTPAHITFFDKPGLFAGARPPASVFVIAVKPQILDFVCREIKGAIPPDALVLSIVAGKKIESLEHYLSQSQPVIRTMPNTPAAIGKGVTVACCNAHVQNHHTQQAENLLKAVGLVEWVDDESLLDAVTALSGSGPAYVFLLMEALGKAGEKAGLSPELSTLLARQTVIGSAALADNDDTSAQILRTNVTSPGGTTEAALNILMSSPGIQDLFDRAITAAVLRSRELNQ